MVLAVKVGKRRPFWRGLLLSVATLGLYGRYWDFRAHDELFRQFELAREGREQGLTWYVMGYPLPVLRFVYYYHFVTNVRYLRARMGYASSLSPGGFLGLTVPATASIYILGFIGLVMLAEGLDLGPQGDVVVVEPDSVAAGQASLVAGLALWTVLKAIAYGLLQRDVNGVWATFDTRSQALMAPPAAAPAAPSAGPPRLPPPAPRAAAPQGPPPGPGRAGPR